MNPVVHLCIVSEQPLGNLIPVLMQAPSRVVLLVTTQMRGLGAAERLAEAVAIHRWAGPAPEVVQADESLPDADFTHIRAMVAATMAREAARSPQARLVLNVTGGTKVMAMAAFVGAVDASAGHAGGLEVIYTDSPARTIEVLHPKPRLERIRAVLDLPTALRAEGVVVEEGFAATVPADWAELAAACARLAAGFDFCTVLTRLNTASSNRRVAGQTMRTLVEDALAHGRTIPDAWLQLSRDELSAQPDRRNETRRKVAISEGEQRAIEELEARGVLVADGEAWRYVSPQMLLFMTGDWIELHVHALACKVFGQAWRNVQVAWKRSGAKPAPAFAPARRGTAPHQDASNEIDVLTIVGNTILVIECKASASPRLQNEYLYKLDAVGRPLVGSRGELVMVNPFKFQSAPRQRAGELRIRMIDGPDLQQLEERLLALRGRHALD